MPDSPPISLAVITADRPDAVHGCAVSYLSGATRPASIFIADDSRFERNAAATLGAARRVARESGLPVRYAGRRERERFVRKLSAAGIPEEIASFCLLGQGGGWFTAGANRNAALLELRGNRVLMVDDDTVGRAAVWPGGDGNVINGGSLDPTDISFFRSREMAIAGAEWAPADLIATTRGYAGAGFETGRIALVSYGVVGDSGFYSPVHLLWMASGSTTERLRQSDADLETALTSREVIRLAPQPVATRGTVFMATALGMDNSQFLPPFLPVGRNEDGFFGNLLYRCLPDAWTLHAPVAVLHDSPAGRGYQRGAGDQQTIRFSELVILLLSACPVASGAAADSAFRELGRYLLELSGNPRQFADYARAVVAAARLGLLARIEDQFGELEGYSPLWRREISSFQQNVRELAASPACWQPAELLNVSETEMLSEVCRLVGLTGELLAHWPEMVRAVDEGRRDGYSLSIAAG